MGAALGWGSLAASSLVIGGLLGVAREWPLRWVGLVLAFGAGALVSAVSFDLAQEGAQVGTPGWLGLGLAIGALVYFLADRKVESMQDGGGEALALGALLDGVPEQLVLGIGVAAGEGVGVGLLVAIFVSNLPESIAGSTDMRAAGQDRGSVVRLWTGIAVLCAAASVAGWVVAETASGNLQAGIDGFAAGALLVMLVDTMIPEARRKGGRVAGLATVLGFAVAAGLSGIE